MLSSWYSRPQRQLLLPQIIRPELTMVGTRNGHRLLHLLSLTTAASHAYVHLSHRHQPISILSSAFLTIPTVRRRRRQSMLHAATGSDATGGINRDDSSFNNTVVTKEDFLRDMLQDPVVKRKNRNKHGYKVLDNRDSLPYRVQINTPDPYTHPEQKKKHVAQHKVRRPPGNFVDNGIASKLYKYDNDQDNAVGTLLGEFMLDKHTTTGDVLEIGSLQYKVTRHRCQYKYAGGRHFVMVRKILEVKETGRLQAEEYLQRQYRYSGGTNSNSDNSHLQD